MAKCSICGKSVLFGNKVSHSHRRSNKIFKPNIRKVNVQTEKGNRKIYVCTSCLRSGNVLRAVKTPAVSLDSIVIEESVLEAIAPETSAPAESAETAEAGAPAQSTEAVPAEA